jgi:predicted nucleic acid-binding protein
VRVVIADTGPLNYLLLIDHIDLLPRLFETVLIPQAVCAELADDAAPQIVRDWIAGPPSWLITMPTPAMGSPLPKLDAGEQAAIALAVELKADLLLMDDRAGVKAALAQGLEVVGTLGILDQAASAGLVDLSVAFARLIATNFRVRPDLIKALLTNPSVR